MHKIEYYINISSLIIGFFKKNYILSFEIMKEYISENYRPIIKNETGRVHFVITFIYNSIIFIGIEKKPRYFNNKNNCEYNILITIPDKNNVSWGHKFKQSEMLNDFDPSSDKNILFKLVNINDYTSIENYLSYCSEEIIILMDNNKLIEKLS